MIDRLQGLGERGDVEELQREVSVYSSAALDAARAALRRRAGRARAILPELPPESRGSLEARACACELALLTVDAEIRARLKFRGARPIRSLESEEGERR